MTNHNKLTFLITTLALSLASTANGQDCPDTCAATLAEAKGTCLRECVNKNPVAEWGGPVDFATNGASRLWQCLPDSGRTTTFSADGLLDFIGCCEFSDACKTTFLEARQCSQRGCISPCIKTTAQEYVGCIVTASKAGDCPFAGFGCVGQLTGNEAFDFDAELANKADTVTTTDCSPMDGFVDGICDISTRCCDACNGKMGQLASCLVNNFLLTFSSANPNAACDIQVGASGTCEVAGAIDTSVSRSGGRLAETNSSEEQETDLLVDANITECEEGLTTDFIIHNETYAANNFMMCVSKKVGQILAEEDISAQNNGGSSARTLFGTLALSSSLAAALLTGFLSF